MIDYIIYDEVADMTLEQIDYLKRYIGQNGRAASVQAPVGSTVWINHKPAESSSPDPVTGIVENLPTRVFVPGAEGAES
jgi:hypothetical protein